MFIPDPPYEDHWCKHETAMRACVELSGRLRERESVVLSTGNLPEEYIVTRIPLHGG